MRALFITTNPHVTIAKPSMNVVNSGVKLSKYTSLYMLMETKTWSLCSSLTELQE